MSADLVAHSFELRERLLAALLADSSHVLIHHDPVLAVVRAGANDIALLTYGGPEPLLEHIAQLRTAKRTTMLHIVAVGASSDATRVMRGQYSMWKAIFAYHRVGPDGTFEKVAGRACRPLEKAAHALASFAPLTAESLQAAAEHGARAGREQAHFAAALTRGFPVVTTVIGVACVVLYGLQWFWGRDDELAAIFRMGGNLHSLVADGEVWRLLASAFLHGNWAHLAVNMVALASFGPMLESLLGRPRFLALYGLSALGGAAASAALGDAISVGASGAIWGLMAAGVGLALRPRGLLPVSVIADARQRALVPLILNVVASFSIEGIDIWAHFGGGAVGLALMLTGLLTMGLHPAWSEKGPSAPPRAPAIWIALATVLGLAMAGSIGAALVTGKPWQLRGPVTYTRVVVGNTGISLEIPERLASAPIVSSKGDQEVVTYHAGESGRGIEVNVSPGPTSLSQALKSDFFEQATVQLRGPGPLGTKPVGEPSIVLAGDRRWVFARHVSEILQVTSWYTAMGGRHVWIRVVLPVDNGPPWTEAPERITASLQLVPGR
jgi:rhomboid protease GluP